MTTKRDVSFFFPRFLFFYGRQAYFYICFYLNWNRFGIGMNFRAAEECARLRTFFQSRHFCLDYPNTSEKFEWETHVTKYAVPEKKKKRCRQSRFHSRSATLILLGGVGWGVDFVTYASYKGNLIHFL